MADLRYPIGPFVHRGPVTSKQISSWIDDIATLPGQLRAAVDGLTNDQLDAPYREDGWTVRQVVHHLADSHMHSYLRFKWALTEDAPTIKTYYEDRWAELSDHRLIPIETNLDFIALLHARWVILLRSLSPGQLRSTFDHPESGKIELAWNVGNYAWHGRHHVAHITSLRDRQGWF